MHISIAAEKLFEIGGWPVTNALLLSSLVFITLAGAAVFLRNKMAMIPGKLQSIFELLLEEILKLMDSLLGSRRLSERYLPLIATIFLFVVISNWFGLLPLGAIGIREGEKGLVPLFRSPASDLNFTLALALISILSINILGITAIGFIKHAKKFFNFSHPIYTFVGLLEFIAEFVKIISFSFRLFGNVFAGEVLLAIVGFLVPYVLPLPFLFLEVFVGFIQAFIFAMLTLVFVAMAVREEAGH